jgi:hypothetical protein
VVQALAASPDRLRSPKTAWTLLNQPNSGMCFRWRPRNVPPKARRGARHVSVGRVRAGVRKDKHTRKMGGGERDAGASSSLPATPPHNRFHARRAPPLHARASYRAVRSAKQPVWRAAATVLQPLHQQQQAWRVIDGAALPATHTAAPSVRGPGGRGCAGGRETRVVVCVVRSTRPRMQATHARTHARTHSGRAAEAAAGAPAAAAAAAAGRPAHAPDHAAGAPQARLGRAPAANGVLV